MTKPPDHWNKHAAQWNPIRSPLRSAAEDIRAAERALLAWEKSDVGHATGPAARRHARNRALALVSGNTPDCASITRAMIRGVWRGASQDSAAVCANWTALPLPEALRDVIAGDGCFSALSFPSEYQAMVRGLRGGIRRDGVLRMRFFTRPEAPESVAVVVDDLVGGRAGNFHAFKWRLGMALYGPLDA